MNLKINIKEDKELRNGILKMIEEQVKGISREVFTEIISTETKRKINNTNTYEMNRIIEKACSSGIILEHINKEVEKHIPNILPMIRRNIEKACESQIAKIVKKNIDEEVKLRVDKKIKSLLEK